MASNLRIWRRPWDRQPQDLVRLAEDLPFGSLAYIPGLPLLGNAPQSAISAPNSLQYGGTPVGYAVEGNFSSAKLLVGTLPRFRTSQGMTWVAQIVSTTTSTRYVSSTVSTGTSYIEDFGVNLDAQESNSAGKVMLLMRMEGGASVSRAGSTNAVLTSGVPATVVWEFTGGANFRLAVNGTRAPLTVNQLTNTDNAIGQMEFPLALLNRNLRNAFSAGGTGLKLSFFARIPRGGLDIQQISANPYALIEPRRIWVPVSAGGGGGFQAAWARNRSQVIGAGVI